MLKYHAVYHEIEDGWFMAKVLDFPGAVSQGRTLKSARLMIRDALKGLADFILEKGGALPRPDPHASDKTAFFIEMIPLSVRSRTGALHEKKEAAQASGKTRLRARTRRR